MFKKRIILIKKDLQCLYKYLKKRYFCEKTMFSVRKKQLECNESKYEEKPRKLKKNYIFANVQLPVLL